MNKIDLINEAMKQLSFDLSCDINDFKSSKNKVVLSKLNRYNRRFIKEKPFCYIASFGSGTVASVDEKVFDWFNKFLLKFDGYRYFDGAQTMAINHELKKHNMCLPSYGEYYLPDLNASRIKDSNYEIRVLYDNEIFSLYNDNRFNMALSYHVEADRRDIIAVVAYENKNIMGVAGATNDTDLFYQIGIDVLPQYRNKGVAITLTSIITEEILKLGKIPYYGTSWANIASKKVALKSGYFPAWIEMNALTIEEAKEYVDEEI